MARMTAPGAFIDHARVATRGRVTIPKDIRGVLGIENTGSVGFVVEADTVRLVNPAVYAMQLLRKEMAREERLSEDEAVELAKAARRREI